MISKIYKEDTNHFESDRFLSEVKIQIRRQYKTQSNFASALYVSRKHLNRILNNPNPDEISLCWVNQFASKLGLNLSEFII